MAALPWADSAAPSGPFRPLPEEGPREWRGVIVNGRYVVTPGGNCWLGRGHRGGIEGMERAPPCPSARAGQQLEAGPA